MKYRVKDIKIFWSGGWQADCVSNGNRFALHRLCCKTKKSAIAIAKQEIKFLNEKEVNI